MSVILAYCFIFSDISIDRVRFENMDALKTDKPTCRSCRHLVRKALWVECGLMVKNDRADKNRKDGKCQLYKKEK